VRHYDPENGRIRWICAVMSLIKVCRA
jgi:hypothetical protein